MNSTQLDNNYLDLIISELKNFPENSSQILSLIQSKKNVFNRFKREFIKNINNIKNQNLKAFALLVACMHKKDEFLQILNNNFDYSILNSKLSIFAKNIYFAYKNPGDKAANLLLDCLGLYNNLFKNQSNLIDMLCLNIKDPIKLNIVANTFAYYHNDKENFFRFNELAISNINTNLPILPPPPIIPYNSETCLESVNKIIDILESIGEKPFLEGGTLLGMYREGKLIEFDYDADIGIIIDNSKYTNKQNMKNYVNKIIRLILADSSFKSIIVCDDEDYYYLLNIFDTHMNHIDLSFFYKNFFNEPNNNSLYTGCPSAFTPLLWECSNFNLVRKNFAGKKYWVPNDTEKYLIENYGENWRTPIERFSNYENIPKQCKLGCFYRYFPALIESLRRKNYDRSIIYYENLQRWEYPFTLEMKNHIENYLEQIKANEK